MIRLISTTCFAFLVIFATASIAQDSSSDSVRQHVIPFVNQFSKSLTKSILQDTKYGEIPYQNEQKQQVIDDSRNAYYQAKKDVADFKAQYKKPPQCYDMKDSATRIHCANLFMKAREEFDAARK